MKDHEFSQSVAKLLAADGFAPSIDQDGDIVLDFEGTRYWIEVDEHDRNCLCVLMPGFWPIESDYEHLRALAVASTINASRELVKIYLHRNDTSAWADVLFERLEDFPPLLRRVLVALRMAVDGFAEGMRENT
jgi:hypothetical protein